MTKPQAYLVLSLLFAAIPSFADDYLKRYDCDPNDAKNVLENLKSSPMRFYTVINGDGAAGNYKPLNAAMLSDEQVREDICRELEKSNQAIGGRDESEQDPRQIEEEVKEIFSAKGRLYQILESVQKKRTANGPAMDARDRQERMQELIEKYSDPHMKKKGMRDIRAVNKAEAQVRQEFGEGKKGNGGEPLKALGSGFGGQVEGVFNEEEESRRDVREERPSEDNKQKKMDSKSKELYASRAPAKQGVQEGVKGSVAEIGKGAGSMLGEPLKAFGSGSGGMVKGMFDEPPTDSKVAQWVKAHCQNVIIPKGYRVSRVLPGENAGKDSAGSSLFNIHVQLVGKKIYKEGDKEREELDQPIVNCMSNGKNITGTDNDIIMINRVGKAFNR